jgi:predicted RNase H-like HicB family nuclease
MKLQYPILIYPSPEGGFVGEASQLRGCIAQGETEFECLAELEHVMALWLEAAERNQIPLPDTSRFVEHLREAINA